ncbi:MAG: hypothetical protein ACK5KV_03030 [Bacteroides graminisolvens]|uniref:hypothetical protein n=1 Tax=Bacteroides graminisolvens TaxID=477666 RepID=UPI003A85D27A
MLLKTITGVESVNSILCQKPISHLFIRAILPDAGKVIPSRYNCPVNIRVRLIDVKQGKTTEVLPNSKLSFVAEYATKYEGMEKDPWKSNETGKNFGESTFRVLLGSQLTDGRIAAVDLSNEKYFDLDLSGLDKDLTYEIYGIESHLIESFVRVYSVFYMPKDEEQRSYNTGENEVLLIPISGLREVQFYAKNGRSFTLTDKELESDGLATNDFVALPRWGSSIAVEMADPTSYIESTMGASLCAALSIDEFDRVDIRRKPDYVNNPLNFMMVDTRPSALPN